MSVAVQETIITTAQETSQGPVPAAASTIRNAGARTTEAPAQQAARVLRGRRGNCTATTNGRQARTVPSSATHTGVNIPPNSGTNTVLSAQANVTTKPATITTDADHDTASNR